MVDDKPLENLTTFLEFKVDRKPVTQIKIFKGYDWYKNTKLPPVDNVLYRMIFTQTNKTPDNKDPCQHLYYNPAITWDGYFVLCCVDWRRESVVGNIKENSITMLWRIVRYIRELQQRGIFIDPCNKCHRVEELRNNV